MASKSTNEQLAPGHKKKEKKKGRHWSCPSYRKFNWLKPFSDMGAMPYAGVAIEKSNGRDGYICVG